MQKMLNKILFLTLISLPLVGLATVHLHPVTWKGNKWEYLVEHPTDIQHIDPIRMEEVLDTAGQHGWELVGISSAFHFYAFYFKRPLADHKLTAHRQHLVHVKRIRHHKAAKIQTVINQAHQEKLASERQAQQ